ncbi:MAG: sulfotransferase family protein, partial [Bacteroidia bacterium]
GNKDFTEPFFEETIACCRSHPYNSAKFRSVSSLDSMIEWSGLLPEIHRPAFIFHVSRCGSTLVSQLIGLDEKYTVLSEVPLFDELLRVSHKLNNIDERRQKKLFQAAVKFVGQSRTGSGDHLFIKTDSWHICFHKRLRQFYPDAPFFLLYRSPDEVVYSHQKLRGMQAVPGLIEPEIFGLDKKEIKDLTLDAYTARVLENYLLLFEKVAAQDKLARLFDYRDGAMDIMMNMGKYLKINWGEGHIENMHKRVGFHSKYPRQTFSKDETRNEVPEYLQNAVDAYRRLAEIR